MRQIRPHLFVAIAVAIAMLSGLNRGVQNSLTDLAFGWSSRSASGDIVIVAIDPSSIAKVGTWPWPRQIHADLIDELRAADVADIVFDVDFSSPSASAADAAFAGALKRSGGSVVLPWFRQAAIGEMATHINRPLPEFADNAWLAVVNVSVEHEGLVRHYPFGERLDGEFIPSMGAMLAGRHNAAAQPFLIDFGIRAASIPIVAYADVLDRNPAVLHKLKGKKVIIGGTALELGDRFSVPNGAVVPGPLLQALAAESILQNRALSQTSDLVTAGNLVFLALIMILAWRRYSAATRVGALVVLAVLVEAQAILVQREWPIVIETATLLLAIGFYVVAVGLDELDFRSLLGRVAERRFTKIAMSLGDALVCADSGFHITVWNPAAEAIFGYSSGDLIGQPFAAIWADGAQAIAWTPASFLEMSHTGGGHVVELEGRRKSGELFPLEASFSSWEGAGGLQYGAILRDISVRRQEEKRIRYLAEHDALTGLANQNALGVHLNAAIASAALGSSEAGLLLISVDSYHQVNDMMGHADGDLLLQAIAQRLQEALGEEQILARMMGDEFAVCLRGTDLKPALGALANRLFAVCQAPLLAGTRRHNVRISMAGARAPEDGSSAAELLGNCHLALNRAKARPGCVMFERSIRDEVTARLVLEAELAQACDRHEFELFYQPQIRLEDGALIGAEALIRWNHPTRGIVSPAEFMPVINESALSDKVASWVMNTACAQARAWQLGGRNIRIGVNLAPSQLQSADLTEAVADVLRTTGLSPELLELEVTEDILLDDEQRVLAIFRRIQNLGVRLVFDDFGTGFASLSYLKKFPLDGLKIDKSFVMDLRPDTANAAIVSSTIELSDRLGLDVIAEGIEDQATADLLLRMGCADGQGYFFGKPMRATEFARRLMINTPRIETSLSDEQLMPAEA